MSYFLVRFLVFSHLDLGPWDSHELIRFGSPKSVYLFPTCQARVSRFCQSCMPGLLNLLNRELQISVGTAGPQMSDRMPDRMPDRMSEYKSDKMPNRNPDRMSECIFQKCQNVYSRKNARWNVRMYIPERMPDGMSECIFQKCQNVYSRKNARWNVRMYIPERMPDRMSEYVSGRMPDRMSEYVSDRISVGGDERIYVCVTMFFGKV